MILAQGPARKPGGTRHSRPHPGAVPGAGPVAAQAAEGPAPRKMGSGLTGPYPPASAATWCLPSFSQ